MSVIQAEERVMQETAKKKELSDLQSALDSDFGSLREAFMNALSNVLADYSELQQTVTGITEAQKKNMCNSCFS